MKYSESKTAFAQEINYEIAGTHFLRTVFFYKEFCRSESVSSLHLLWLFAVRSSRSCLFSAPLSMNAVASTHIILWCVQVFVVYLLAIWNLEFGNGLPFLLETYPSIIKKERLGFLPWKACFQLKKKKVLNLWWFDLSTKTALNLSSLFVIQNMICHSLSSLVFLFVQTQLFLSEILKRNFSTLKHIYLYNVDICTQFFVKHCKLMFVKTPSFRHNGRAG